jgi:hypothetical protein
MRATVDKATAPSVEAAVGSEAAALHDGGSDCECRVDPTLVFDLATRCILTFTGQHVVNRVITDLAVSRHGRRAIELAAGGATTARTGDAG